MAAALQVVVQDEVACVDAGLLAASLSDVEAPSATVRVVVRAEGDARAVDVQVVRDGTVLWSKPFETVATACPSMPEAIAASVAAAIDMGILSGREAPPAPSAETLLPVSATFGVPVPDAPSQPRIGLGLRRQWGAGPWFPSLGVATEVGFPFDVGSGHAWLGQGGMTAGVALAVSHDWRVVGGASGGLTLARGYGFADDLASVGPAASAWMGVANRRSHAVELQLALRVNVVTVSVAEVPRSGEGVLTGVEEPRVRAELTLAPVLARKSGDGREGRGPVRP